MASVFKLAPSILSANFLKLEQEIHMLNASASDWIHFDVMDGHFVPNISFGLTVLEAVAPIAQKPLDVHLMITAPERYVKQFAQKGAQIITIHLEATTQPLETLKTIKQLGCQAGLAINPHTSVKFIDDALLQECDLVNIMSVNPGFGGQKFIEKSVSKVKELKEKIKDISPQTLIEIDGGITQANINAVVKAGVDVVVAGSFVFNSQNPKDTIAHLKQN